MDENKNTQVSGDLTGAQPGGNVYQPPVNAPQPGGNVYQPPVNTYQPGGNVYRPPVNTYQPGGNVYRGPVNVPQPAGALPPQYSPAQTDELKSAKRSFSRMGFALLALGGVTITLQAVIGAAVSLISPSGLYSGWMIWLLNFLPLYLIAFPVYWLILRRMPRAELESKHLGVKRFFLMLLFCFPLMYGGNIIGNVLSMLFSGGSAENPLESFAMESSFMKVLFMVILAPIFEELMFRKLLVDRAARYGEKTAMILSGVCFGLFHMNLFQFFYATALGMLFAYIYIRTRRIQYTMLLHMIINFLGGVVAPWLLSLGGTDALEQMMAGQTPSGDELVSLLPLLIYSFSMMGAAVAGLIVMIVRSNRIVFLPAEKELPKGSRFRTVYLALGMIFFIVFCVGMTAFSLYANS